MSRPEIPINWDKVDELLEAGCSGVQVAASFGLHPDTFYRRIQEKYNMGFTEYYAVKNQHGEAQLIAAQHQKAIGKTRKGDTTLLTYLGKVRLKQREPEQESNVTEEITKRYLDVMDQLNKIQSPSKEESCPLIKDDSLSTLSNETTEESISNFS